MSTRPGYTTVQTTMMREPIEIPLDELEVLRSQGLIAATPIPTADEPEPEPLAVDPAPEKTSTRKAKP
jgi:hypothetical protein